VIELPPLHITIVEANDYRVDMVRIVKEQSATTKMSKSA
jgi:CBS domain containing-hemolysin-like protein